MFENDLELFRGFRDEAVSWWPTSPYEWGEALAVLTLVAVIGIFWTVLRAVIKKGDAVARIQLLEGLPDGAVPRRRAQRQTAPVPFTPPTTSRNVKKLSPEQQE